MTQGKLRIKFSTRCVECGRRASLDESWLPGPGQDPMMRKFSHKRYFEPQHDTYKIVPDRWREYC